MARPTEKPEALLKKDVAAILAGSAWHGADPGALDAVAGASRLERLARRTVLCEQGEPAKIFVILGSGRVRVERSFGARSVTLAYRGRGEATGDAAFLGGASTETATVVDEARALVVSAITLRHLLASEPSLRAGAVRLLVERRRTLEERVEGLLLHSVEHRLVTFLLDASERWGLTVVEAPFTHAEIALLIGSTRETVTLLLGKLKRAGLIAFDQRRLVILDRAALARRADN